MAEEREVRIVDIQLNYESTVRGLADLEKKIIAAKEAQEEMQKSMKQGGMSEEEYNRQTEALVQNRAALAQLTRERAKMQKELANQMKMEKEQVGSLNAMRAELSILTAQYDEMGEKMRGTEVGEKLAQDINTLTKEIKKAEEATGRYYRNVGNYTNSVIAAFEKMDDELEALREEYEKVAKAEGVTSERAEELRKKITQQEAAINNTKAATQKLYSTIIPFGDKILPLLGKGLAGAKEGLKLVADGAKIVGKQFLTLMMNPIVAFLAAVAAAIAIVINGIKGSEENMNKWRKAMAPLQAALGLLQTGLEMVCGWILSAIEYAGKLAQLLGRLAEAATSFMPSVSAAIHEANAAVEHAIELEEREQRLIKDRRALLVEEAKTENEVARLREQASDVTKTQTERIEALGAAIEAEERIAAERVRLAKEELEIEKQKASMAPNSAADNERLAELEANVYKAEANLYKQRKEMSSQMSQLRLNIKKEEEAAAAARVEAAKTAAKKEAEAIREAEDAMLALIKDADEKRKKEAETRTAREIEALRDRLATEKDLTAAARDAINQTITAKEEALQNELTAIDEEAAEKRRQQEAEAAEKAKEMREAQAAEELLRIQNDWAEKMQQAADNSLTQAQLELQQAEEARAMLQQAEEESDEAFRARQLEADKRYQDAKKKLADTEVQVQQAKFQMLNALTGGLGKALEALGEDNKAFAKMSKVLALGEIAINTGKAIAAGTAQAQSVPYPANLVAMATTIATVLANVATAISTVKSAKFAAGIVGINGRGSTTSDSIPAMLSQGESVMNAAATALFSNELQAMNNIGRSVTPEVGGVTMNNAQPSMLGEAIREAVADIRPVVTVEDINEQQNRVEVVTRRGFL